MSAYFYMYVSWFGHSLACLLHSWFIKAVVKHKILIEGIDNSFIPLYWVLRFSTVSFSFDSTVKVGWDTEWAHYCRSISLFPAMIPKALAHFISIIVILRLQDIWQLLHPTGKSYSDFTSIHHCHWRIDFSLLCSNLSQFILDCSMWNILISYHTAIQLTILF